MLQEKTWVRAEGTSEQRGLVGQVYFALNSDDLDQQDERLIAELARRYKIPLLGHRIELTFVGHADKRGAVSYNRKLGFRRSRAVRSFMDGILGRGAFPLYSSKDALSRGELDAAQGRVSADQMALDRRVDIFSSYIPDQYIRMPPLHIEAERNVKRIAYREFRSSKGKDMFDMANPDPLGDAIENLINHLGTRGEALYGNEVKSSRRITIVPVTHRVNSVLIRNESSSKVGLGYSAEASNSYVTYEWGPPKETLTVTWKDRKKDLSLGMGGKVTETSRTKTYPRGKVEWNAMIFPPDPE